MVCDHGVLDLVENTRLFLGRHADASIDDGQARFERILRNRLVPSRIETAQPIDPEHCGCQWSTELVSSERHERVACANGVAKLVEEPLALVFLLDALGVATPAQLGFAHLSFDDRHEALGAFLCKKVLPS